MTARQFAYHLRRLACSYTCLVGHHPEVLEAAALLERLAPPDPAGAAYSYAGSIEPVARETQAAMIKARQQLLGIKPMPTAQPGKTGFFV